MIFQISSSAMPRRGIIVPVGCTSGFGGVVSSTVSGNVQT